MEQTTRKTNKKKLVVALALLALIVVASVITTVVLVLASSQQSVESNINVTYQVTDVSATISGRYGVKKTAEEVNAAATLLDKKMTPNSATINPADTTGPKMTPEEATIALKSDKDFVVFEYGFTNNTPFDEETSTAETPFTIALTYTDVTSAEDATANDKNILVRCKASTTAIGETDLNAAFTRSTKTWAEGWSTISDTNWAGVTCHQTYYVYVIVAIDDINTAATFSGNFKFVLTAAAE